MNGDDDGELESLVVAAVVPLFIGDPSSFSFASSFSKDDDDDDDDNGSSRALDPLTPDDDSVSLS